MGRVTNQKIDTINMHVNKYLMFHASGSRLTKNGLHRRYEDHK